MEYKIYNYFTNHEIRCLQGIGDSEIKALAMLSRVYRDKLDKSGNPEIGHFIRVSESFTHQQSGRLFCTDEEVAKKGVVVGLLHDVVEDRLLKFDDLRLLGFDEEIINSLILLYHNKNKCPEYHDYITAIIESDDDVAKWTKYFDMFDNTTPYRLELLNPELYDKLTNKYKNEFPRLQACVLQIMNNRAVKRERVIV